MKIYRFNPYTMVRTFLLMLVVAVTLLPFLYMINVSLSGTGYVLRGEVSLWPKGFNLDSYVQVLNDKRIAIGYKNTLIYVVAGTALSLMLTAMAGYALSRRHMVFNKPIMVLLLVTMLFNGGMIPTFLVVRSYGLVDTMWAMLLPGAISVWYLILMRTFFQAIPNEMIESGKMDGLNDIGIFIRLVLPVSLPSLATIGLFYGVGIWNNFFSALLYLRSESLFPLQVFLRNIVMLGLDLGDNITRGSDAEAVLPEALKYATIIVSTLPIMLVYPFVQKYFVSGIMIGSIKG